jgi:hypothetical protein
MGPSYKHEKQNYNKLTNFRRSEPTSKTKNIRNLKK